MAKKEQRTVEIENTDLLARLVGSWSGSVSTWFEPGSAAFVEKISGKIAPVLKSKTIAHTYRTRLEGKTAQGTAIIGKDIATLKLCVSWMDSLHTAGDVMLFQRDKHNIKNGFSVAGHYAAGPDGPPWGWRTTYELKNARALEIIHYNVTPDGHECMAVQVDYRRAQRR